MKVHLSRLAGFCDGVKRAYEIVMSIDMKQVRKPVFVLGSLVHNEEVIKKIEEKGISKIDREKFLKAGPEDLGTLVVNAHGAGPDIFKKAKKLKIDILDTTCPRVIKVQKLAQLFSKKGHKIIIVGDRDHKEVKGINEWSGGEASIISRESDIDKINFDPEEQITVLAQTTQNEDFYKKIGELLKRRYKNVQTSWTTCHTTHARQKEIKSLARDYDAVIIIGSKSSANSKRLFEISKNINPLSFFVEKAREVDLSQLNGFMKVAITAGASTPDWTICEVMEHLKKA